MIHKCIGGGIRKHLDSVTIASMSGTSPQRDSFLGDCIANLHEHEHALRFLTRAKAWCRRNI